MYSYNQCGTVVQQVVAQRSHLKSIISCLNSSNEYGPSFADSVLPYFEEKPSFSPSDEADLDFDADFPILSVPCASVVLFRRDTPRGGTVELFAAPLMDVVICNS